MKKLSALSLAVVLSMGGMTAAQAADVLNVNLSVPNQITITALPGTSFVTASGLTGTGFYFANLLSGTSASLLATGTGTLTAASVVSDGTPSIYHINTTDPGLNIYGYSGTTTTTFTAGSLAFTGTATFTLPAAIYTAALAGSRAGSVYFPADDITDLPTAQIIGSYTVTTAPVPEPATAVLMGLGALGLLVARRRVKEHA